MEITRKDELAAWVKSVYRNAPQGETENDKKNLSDVLEIISREKTQADGSRGR